MALAPGTRLGHFEIIAPIGAGGMGEVYRARDVRLDREVAIKVLPTGALGDEKARRRFRKEALALSKLDHPNIATVLEFDTQDGVDFLAMGLISGASLREKLCAGPLPEQEVLRLGAQLAEGLVAAHEQGVVHRDLKPANLRVTREGRLKILDFGLASLRKEADADTSATTGKLSMSGEIAGTPPYMAPEQLRGERVDARTDVYAAGAVLYEMATGRRPFVETGPSLIDAILNRTPQPPSGAVRGISAGLEFVILKALEKDPARRYQSTRELLVDLERLLAPSSVTVSRPARRPVWRRVWIGGSVLALAVVVAGQWLWRSHAPRVGAITSLAVLPLKNFSADPAQEFLADGMTDALIADLAQIKALKVISRTSVMQYKDAKKPLPEIAKELGVDGIVEGSVQRSGNRVRITAQLIHAATDRNLWAESVDRDMTDILVLQGDIARAIAGEIRLQVSTRDGGELAHSRKVDPEAYDLYLKGQHFANLWTEEGLRKGIDHLRQAVDRDPTYAPAWAALGTAYVTFGFFLYTTPTGTRDQARAATQKAVDLDPQSGEAHAALGWVKAIYDWELNEAERLTTRALELSPNSVPVLMIRNPILVLLGRFDEALALNRRAIELDPLSLSTSLNLAWTYYNGRRYNEALAQLEHCCRLDRRSPLPWQQMAWNHTRLGQTNAATAAADRAIELLGDADDQTIIASMAWVYGMAGQHQKAIALRHRLEDVGKRRWLDPFILAVVHEGLGDITTTLKWIERGILERSTNVIFLPVDPTFGSVTRSHPRYADLCRRARMPEPLGQLATKGPLASVTPMPRP